MITIDHQGNHWHDGEPPAVGWFPASLFGFKDNLRYWNGRDWSQGCVTEKNYEEASWAAEKMAAPEDRHRISWMHQPRDWPENARTYERIDSEP